MNRFAKYLLSNIYFVVIETRAGLSKTLQIFNAINTTGLDLSGGDLFKIRMYEYLTHNEKEDKSVFEDISKLYQKIDQKNAQLNWDNSINDILSIYQYVIISKYNLPTTLYYLGVDTFFERLFDTILKINQWEHFKNNVKDVKLSLSEIDKIIDIRYNWERKLKNKEGFTAEDICALNLIWSSRYSRYWNLIFVFLFAYENVEDNWNKMLMFTKQLNRFFFIYSIRFQKIKSEVYYGEVQSIIYSIVNLSFENTMTLLKDSIGDRSKHNTDWYDLDWFLTEKLTENAKRKKMICRLSAMLEEDYHTNNCEEINNIENKLFQTPIDIEHIQSFLDKNQEIREDIHKEWEDEINSIGNLMILEEDINRSIGNNCYEEKVSDKRGKSYRTSQFKIVQNQANIYKEWNLEKCKERKQKEMTKMMNYLFM